MKLNQLRDFVAVAENGSLREASRTLRVAQPAITRSIQELEHSLGAQLFIREAKGVRLTSVGELFFGRAMSILSDVRRAREAVHQQQDGFAGELVVGASIAGHLGLLGPVLPAFRRRYPGVRLKVIEGLLSTLETNLRTGVVDIFIGPVVRQFRPADLQVVKLFDNKRVVIGRRNHPLANARSLRDLAGAEWVTTSITHQAADELAQVFAEYGLPEPRVAAQCQSALSILTVLTNTELLAMLPIQWIESQFLGERLGRIQLDDEFDAPPIMLVHRSGIGLTPAGKYLMHLVLKAAKRDRQICDTKILSIERI